MKAALLYSGGLDSTVMLYDFRDSIELCIYFDDGSLQSVRQVECAKAHCENLGKELICIDVKNIFQHIDSPLTREPQRRDAPDYDEMNCNVPFRNGIFISIATAIAESRKLDTVFIASIGGVTHLPDCTENFLAAMWAACQGGTKTRIQLFTPYSSFLKADVIKRGIAYNGTEAKPNPLNMSKTWSCFSGGDIQCGVCAPCSIRRKRLGEVGLDSTTYLQ